MSSNKIDSLKKLIPLTTQNDAKFKLYGDICWEYLVTRTRMDTARLYADSIKSLAEELTDQKGMAYANFYYGVIERHKGSFSKSLDHLWKYVEYYEKIGDSIRVAYGLFQISAVNNALGNYQESLANYYRILDIYKSNNSYYDVGYTLNGIGVIYKNMGKHEDALETYFKALSIYDSLSAEEDKANLFGNIANVYVAINDFEKAKYYYQQALKIDYATGSNWGVAYSLENIGDLLNNMQQYDSALIYHLQSLAIREKLPQKNEIAISYKQVGHTYFLLKNHHKAEQYLLNGLSLAHETSSKTLIRDYYEVLSKLYAEKKNFSEAYRYHLQYAGMKDSVLNETIVRQLNELQTKFETVEKDKQISILAKEKEIGEKEAERQATLRKAFLAGFIMMVVVAALIAYIFHQRLRNQRTLTAKNEEVREANFKKRLGELELKALQAQINPHFFFNCMNSINRMVLEGESENASIYLTKFSKMVRLILENSANGQVSLSNELKMLESYIQLEELRLKENIGYSVWVDESIDTEDTYLPPMILQPFVENAIWHGLMHREKTWKGKIHITIKEEEGFLSCCVEDNGVGREAAIKLRKNSVWKSSSMGINITEERLKLLSKKKLFELIRITDLKDQNENAVGTRVDINIPIA